MRIARSFGILLALAISTVSTAWSAECKFNEAESLNAKFTSKVIIARSYNGWTPEMEEELEILKLRFQDVGDQHSVAESNDDLAALATVCDDYRALLAEIDDLTRSLE